MKIAFVVGEFPVISQTFIINQIADLIDKGHEVKVFALEEIDAPLLHSKVICYNLLKITSFKTISKSNKHLELLGCLIRNHECINFKRFFKKIKLFSYQSKSFDFNFFRKHSWILEDQSFDIIHAHFGFTGVYMADLLSLGFFSRSRFVTTFHGYDLNPALLPQLERKYLKLFQEVDLMTVNTPYARDLLKRMTRRKEIEVLPMGLDTDLFRRKESTSGDGHFNILFVGRLIELKGPHLAVEILNILCGRGYKNVQLKIAGDGEMKESLLVLIDKHDLGGQVNLLGALPQERIVQIMNESDIFLLPGIYDKDRRAETQGLVIQEAQAMELPVLISDVGGMKYGIMDGETGFVIKENDLKGFADKIEFLVKNPSIKRQIGANGRNFVVDNYNSSLLGERLESIYCDLL
ncbi:colanic acid/amylovoran biosynthesis glycosyltransferase [Salinimicrobium catena]|uniref:Colanic acid/amylovoran biosynthesis glycosyltransferase n=1 Tax=Salinimicrobium catena TaxID=390640 RepID=A0A1H5NAV4_9FLAO|nr:glycosyltransferase [Salinimicrobium catena]SDL41481.1 colanic acid/amylovoran biosynthesis glycosyltransferase [Salinimicrobium catena]SEE98703.1 colanic acid/amylovoran biosynthesis glycosyltransferase [Salinimicrobium catena]